MTHELRSCHDAILVGIQTVLCDDPSLTVRLCRGSNPQPVVLDSKLSIRETCKLVSSPLCVRPLIAVAAASPAFLSAGMAERARRLEALGCTIIPCQPTADGRVDLVSLLRELGRRGVASVMVEGGGAVLRSFLRLRLVDYAVVTVAPTFLGGLGVMQEGSIHRRVTVHKGLANEAGDQEGVIRERGDASALPPARAGGFCLPRTRPSPRACGHVFVRALALARHRGEAGGG